MGAGARIAHYGPASKHRCVKRGRIYVSSRTYPSLIGMLASRGGVHIRSFKRIDDVDRGVLFGANTPWKRVRLPRGFGTSAASQIAVLRIAFQQALALQEATNAPCQGPGKPGKLGGLTQASVGSMVSPAGNLRYSSSKPSAHSAMVRR